MSWMIPIPATTPDQFTTAAQQARAALDGQLADADPDARATAEAQADAAISAASALIAAGVLDGGLVSGALSGRLPGEAGQPYATVAVQLSSGPA